MHKLKKVLYFFLIIFVIYPCICLALELGQDMPKDTPIIVNGDKVEFFREQNKVVAEGNVIIEYGGAVLTCDRITVFTKTKDAFAEGNVKLEDENGTVQGKTIFYNFDTKEGKINQAILKLPPYYCVSPNVEKLATKFILYDADITTCNLDTPHYHFHARKVEIVPEDKLRAKDITFKTGQAPVMYFPTFVQDIGQKRNGMSFTPGRSKEWGDYLLTGYRYYFTDDLKGLLRLDWRTNKGFASGFDLESYSDKFGDSVIKWYFIKESLHGEGEVEPIFKSDERYKFEFRHNWDINDTTQFIMELNDYSDTNLLRNYFYRQFEKESAPDSYALLSHSYPNSTLSLLLRKRVNQFFSETEKIPEIKLETNKFNIMEIFKSKIDETKVSEPPAIEEEVFSLYYKNESNIAALTSRNANTDVDEDAVRLDTYNQISSPFKLAFLKLEPYVGIRETFYSKDKNGDENLFRSVFYSGHTISTKFYRVFPDLKVNSFGLEIDKLRHIITPSLEYAYIHDPTLPSDRLTAFESIDSITQSNILTFSLENKLQTKRDGSSVDFLALIIKSPYNFKMEGHGGRFGDISFDLEILPNSWFKFWSDAAFDIRRRSFRTANFQIEFPLDEKGKVGAEYRYAASDPNDDELFVFTFERQLNPKWKFRSYHRLQFTVEKMIEEQEYTISRDLHCWEVEFTVNSKKKKGVTFWIGFKCKAFPDLGFDFEKGHQQPKTAP